jgi:hypothetical protein
MVENICIFFSEYSFYNDYYRESLKQRFNMKEEQMILYKYVSFSVGSEILKLDNSDNSTNIGFRNPWDFNDSFELAASHALLPNSAFAPIVLRSMFERSVVLSLTRSPLNPLMWAHYAQEHRGFVIGWDADTAGFTDESKNVIPAQHGNVIYTSTRPMHPILGAPAPMNYGQEYAFRPELLEQLQRFFLYKAMCWSYEEEVRVVKCVFGGDLRSIPSGALKKKIYNDDDNNKKPLFLSRVSAEAIKEVYIGINNELLVDHEKSAEILRPWMDTIKLFECRLSPYSWELSADEYKC